VLELKFDIYMYIGINKFNGSFLLFYHILSYSRFN